MTGLTFFLKKFAPIALIVGGILSLAACGNKTDAQQEPETQDIEQARAAADLLGKRLKGRLMAAMNNGGPEAAISVCAEEAQTISAAVSEETGFDVGRTSDRIRNSLNAPDDWESARLAEFRAALENAEGGAVPESAEFVEQDGGQVFRYGRAITLDGPCTMCHGTNVQPKIRALIAERYPDDQATGFEPGELRGMFTVSRAQ